MEACGARKIGGAELREGLAEGAFPFEFVYSTKALVGFPYPWLYLLLSQLPTCHFHYVFNIYFEVSLGDQK